MILRPRNPAGRPDNRAGMLGANPTAPPMPRPRVTGLDRRGAPPLPGGGAYDAPNAGRRPVRGAPPVDPLQAQAQGMVDPLIAAISARIDARAKAGAGAISGYTNSLAQALGGGVNKVRDAYNPIVASTAATENALANRLSGAGEQASNELAGRLAGINAPNAVDPALAAVRQTGTGSANASYGKGAASIEALLGNQAAAETYAGKQPGIARMGGQQSLRDLELKSQADLADQSEQVRAQIPQIVDNLRQRAEGTREFNVSQEESRRQFNRQQKQQMFLAQLANETDANKAAQDWRRFVEQQDREDARAAAAEDARNRRAAATQAGQDRRTQAQIDAENKRAAAAAAKATKAGGLTPAQAAAAQKQAASDADLFYYGKEPKRQFNSQTQAWMDVPGTGVSGIGYGQAVKRLMAKYPTLTKQAAMALLNDYYAPGERGRPGPKPTVTPDQAAAAVGPPSWVTGSAP